MGTKSVKKYDAAFKARVAVEAVKESETLAQIGRRFGVHLRVRAGGRFHPID